MNSAAAAPERLEELILYIASRMERDRHVGRGRMKLAKFLFFIDFEAYARWGRTVSGTTYHAELHGPAPTGELPATRDLEAHGRFEWVHEWDRQELPMARDEANVAFFSAAELRLVDDCLDRYRLVSASKMIDEAHEFAGWQHAWADGAGRGTPVPFESIFWDSSRGPAEAWENAVAQELADRKGI